MIVPSIDLMGGKTVQLVGGRELALEAGDPAPIADRFAVAGEIAVIDLDAALGRGSNAELIRPLLAGASCRVGGGIRDVRTAVSWLDAGAARVILGTAATPEVLRELPRERVIAALDADGGEVVVKGWRERTGRGIVERIGELREHVSGFLVTFVEREGRMQGTDLELARAVIAAAGPARVTIAGGVTTAEDIAELDALGAAAQVGMALYTGRLELADAVAAPLRSDRADGLWPTVVTDERGVALGLAYSSRESLREAVRRRRGVYHSRSRGGLWVKGESSGATQELLRVDLDCDRDALRFTVRQAGGGFCHTGSRTCWGTARGLDALESKLARIAAEGADAGSPSYTARLLREEGLLGAKLAEEARELAEALQRGDAGDIAHEAADLLYFALAGLAKAGVPLAEVERVLDRRALRVTRRGGDAKASVRS
ncbi:MAG: phosphoribosyl-ATP diphosphatase [Planctomycetota bacterium]|nr:phosphoribosyl-ATP diphosphatase [Planctomycetota bacterium]